MWSYQDLYKPWFCLLYCISFDICIWLKKLLHLSLIFPEKYEEMRVGLRLLHSNVGLWQGQIVDLEFITLFYTENKIRGKVRTGQ